MNDAATRNLEAVDRAVALIEAGDGDGFRGLIAEIAHPDIEWAPLISTGVEGSYRGPDGIASFFDDFLGSFEVRYVDRELRPIGDDVVVLLCQLKLKGRGSGLDVDQEMASVFEFEDGLLRRGHAYPNHAEALAAAEGTRA